MYHNANLNIAVSESKDLTDVLVQCEASARECRGNGCWVQGKAPAGE